MHEINLDQLYEQADTELEKALKELNRPSRDVVNYSACVSARRALYHYLSCLTGLYSRVHDVAELSDSPTLEELITYCRKYNEQLKQVDFSNVHCKNCDVLSNEKVYFCNEANVVKHCTEVAREVKNIFLESK
ncbi:MAG: hypothetical protein EA391_11060 [Balneolaceae bacterium]|nr:MAG: hypothetical protein EA391_11060 [Balneolaceae bacterium]